MTLETKENEQNDKYIYGKALQMKVDKFGNNNLMIKVIKEKNYPSKISEYRGRRYAYIKERHLDEVNIEEGKYYRFLVSQMSNYMGRDYVSSYEIVELPEHTYKKYIIKQKNINPNFSDSGDSSNSA